MCYSVTHYSENSCTDESGKYACLTKVFFGQKNLNLKSLAEISPGESCSRTEDFIRSVMMAYMYAVS